MVLSVFISLMMIWWSPWSRVFVATSYTYHVLLLYDFVINIYIYVQTTHNIYTRYYSDICTRGAKCKRSRSQGLKHKSETCRLRHVMSLKGQRSQSSRCVSLFSWSTLHWAILDSVDMALIAVAMLGIFIRRAIAQGGWGTQVSQWGAGTKRKKPR